MTSIADIIRIPFGYMLEFLYNFSGNYGLALILFGIADTALDRRRPKPRGDA